MFENYRHFKNYCLKMASSNNYNISKKQMEIFDKFEIIYNILKKLNYLEVLYFKKDILKTVCDIFKRTGFDNTFIKMNYIINKFKKFKDKEVDFYYITTSLSSALDVNIEFNEDFILNNNKNTSPFYPEKIKVIEIIDKSACVHTETVEISDYNNKFGVYFIYDYFDELVYIGKSTSCLKRRAMDSAEERINNNFSKIELRECKSRSDVAIYEAYYVSKYKPKYNKDLVFDDVVTIELPELEVSKEIIRDKNSSFIEYKVKDLKTISMYTDEFVENKSDNMYLNTHENLIKATQIVRESRKCFNKG